MCVLNGRRGRARTTWCSPFFNIYHMAAAPSPTPCMLTSQLNTHRCTEGCMKAVQEGPEVGCQPAVEVCMHVCACARCMGVVCVVRVWGVKHGAHPQGAEQLLKTQERSTTALDIWRLPVGLPPSTWQAPPASNKLIIFPPTHQLLGIPPTHTPTHTKKRYCEAS